MNNIRQFIYIIGILILVPALASAQNYQFGERLNDGQEFTGGIHGLAVDGENKVWVQPWADTEGYTDGDGNYVETIPIYAFDTEGEHASFSPIMALHYGDDEVDILSESSRNRGLATDHEGNILASLGTVLYRINHQTGEVMTRRDFQGDALAAVGSTDNGEVVVSFAAHNSPIVLLDENFDEIRFIAIEAPLSRSIEISGDGRYVIQFDPYGRASWLHYSEVGVDGPYEMGEMILEGMFVESSAFHPVTGHLWVSAGSRNNPTTEGWSYPAWYGIDLDAIINEGASTQEAIVQEIGWYEDDGESDLRPRGVAFSNGGSRAYFGMYRTSAVQVYTDDTFASNVEQESFIAEEYTLEQNYPNPFNPTTSISFTIAEEGMTSLNVYNLLGQKVATLVNSELSSGSYSVNFDATNLSSGMYIYVLESGNARLSKQMTLIK